MKKIIVVNLIGSLLFTAAISHCMDNTHNQSSEPPKSSYRELLCNLWGTVTTLASKPFNDTIEEMVNEIMEDLIEPDEQSKTNHQGSAPIPSSHCDQSAQLPDQTPIRNPTTAVPTQTIYLIPSPNLLWSVSSFSLTAGACIIGYSTFAYAQQKGLIKKFVQRLNLQEEVTTTSTHQAKPFPKH